MLGEHPCRLYCKTTCSPWWLVESPSPSPKASEDEDNDGDSGSDDDAIADEDASFSDDDEMTASQWLALCHSWQKGEVVLGIRVVMYLGGELV